jgi:hypothetical protein
MAKKHLHERNRNEEKRNMSLPYSLPLWPSVYLHILRDAHHFLLFAIYFHIFLLSPRKSLRFNSSYNCLTGVRGSVVG